MSISFENLKTVLKSTKLPVTRDKAKKGSEYPYIVYSNVSVRKKYASSKVVKRMPYYQISFFTDGTEKELSVLEKVLEDAMIPYPDFIGTRGDENDDTVTNYFTYVRCVEDV